MIQRLLRIVVPLVLVTTVQWTFSTSASSIEYRLTDLGVLPGYSYSAATALNDSGVVVGYCLTMVDSQGSQGSMAFVYDSQGMRALGTLGGDRSSAQGINNVGEIVGLSEAASQGGMRAFLFDGVAMRDLTSEIGVADATAINDAGTIVGYRVVPGAGNRAIVYDRAALDTLDTLGGASSYAYDINALGRVTGQANITNNEGAHAFVHDGVAIHDLGTLGGQYSDAHGINNAGIVVGRSQLTGNVESHAFLRDDSGIRDLGTLGGRFSFAHAINDAGLVVGNAEDAEGRSRAALWLQGQLHDLNDLVVGFDAWTLNVAEDINSLGQIIGTGTVNGQPRAYLLTPIPEPSSVVLVASSIAIMLWRYPRNGVVLGKA